ncbi:hypothetical protein [uncultured Microscilla sp.]|uniref:hypothetical protein n=1 Tax=uncultured Microscilla sp. TaxID=432653 RepID=UPI00261C838A|nr:hypothetical protein [uncultured Microscilla sp.]
MTKTFFIVLLISIQHLSFAQDVYHVINIKGKVSRNGKNIRRGQKLKATDKIKFVSPRALLLVSSQRYGRMVLSAKPAQKSMSEAAYILKNLVSKGRASARGDEKMVTREMIHYYFGKGEPHLILGDEATVKVKKALFPLNKKSFFFMSYQYKGEKVNKKLPFEDNRFTVNKDRLFRVEGKKISGKEINDFGLFYYKNGEEVIDIGRVKLFFWDNAHQKKVDEMVKFMKANELTQEEIKDTVFAYLQKYFGEPNADQFKTWYQKHYQ